MEVLKLITLSDCIQIASIVVALSIGIASIRQNNKQLEVANKQALFDRRYKIYLLLKHMDKLCNENLSLITDKNGLKGVEFIATCLTNSVHFYHICDVFEKGETSNKQVEFLSLIEELRDYGIQATLIFPPKHSEYIKSYFIAYADLLTEMRRYSILLEGTKGLNEELAKRIESDALEYKENLGNLHNKYEKEKNSLREYLALIEKEK